MRDLVFATHNAGKLDEVRPLVSGRFRLLSLRDIGCAEELPETGDTLEANAVEKIACVRDRYGAEGFAEDTGLLVDALGGAPGVLSARFAGPQRSAVDNVRLLLRRLEGVRDRAARFRTVFALAMDGEVRCFTGECEGRIAERPSGTGGFGYDPVFAPEGADRTFAEMTREEKAAVSHRGRALRKLLEFLQRTG